MNIIPGLFHGGPLDGQAVRGWVVAQGYPGVVYAYDRPDITLAYPITEGKPSIVNRKVFTVRYDRVDSQQGYTRTASYHLSADV